MLGIAGFVAMIVLIIQIYKTARNSGRSAPLWALAAFAVGFGFQIVIPLIVGIVLGVVLVMQGQTDPDALQLKISGIANIIGIICIVLSFVGMWLIFKHVSKVVDVPYNREVPPPPPSF